MRAVSVSAPASWPEPGTQQHFIQLDLCALTPIYKGGSTTAQIDEGSPFRVPSIRGALRYWWRATSTIAEVAALRAREEEIFGGVHGDTRVASDVTMALFDQRSAPGPRPTNKAYAFGVTGKEPEGDAKKKQVHNDATGKLRVEWRDDGRGKEVKRALQAWLLFGGTGGRSRRGAGSVWWTKGLEVPATVDDFVKMGRALVPARTSALWPTLHGGALLVGPASSSSDEAWAEGLNGIRDVRASTDVRANFTPVRGRDLLEWKRQDYIPISKGQNFQSSRAALGLPIRFNSKGQGFRGVLNATGHNRYPSPIHLKVARLGEKYHPVLIVLRGPAPRQLQANGTRGVLDTCGLDRFLELASQLSRWACHDLGGAR